MPDVGVVHNALPYLRDGRYKVLGSSQFEDGRILNTPEMQGAWYASAPAKYRVKFEERFIANYDVKPLKISSIAYDASAFIYAIVEGTKDHLVHREFLTDPSGFMGVTGAFRFMDDGSNQRLLTIFEISDNLAKVRAHASTSFVEKGE